MPDELKYQNDIKEKDRLPLLFIIFLPCFFVIFKSLDNDIWFLLSHGRYVLENGFPHVEPFTIHQNFHFVMQQWLSSVIFWVVYSGLGDIGVKLLTMVCYALIVFIIYKLCMKVSENNFFLSFSITLAVSIVLSFFMLSRPYIFSAAVFALELYILENYKSDGNKKVLLFLPLLSVLLINLHSAMWPMMFVLFLPYAVETLKFKIGPFSNAGAEKKWLFLAALISVPAGFLNPYGFEAMTYLAKSYGYEQINMFVQEMQPANINESFGMIVFLCLITVALTYFLYKKGTVKLRYMILALGTGYMALSSYRNLLFFALCAFFPLAAYLKDFELPVKQDKNPRKTRQIRRLLIALIILLMPLGFYATYVSGIEVNTGYALLNETLDVVAAQGNAQDTVLYTGYGEGNLAEFRGVRTYMDARAEVFVKKNNRIADVFQEYTDMQAGRIYYKDVLEKYKFTHILLANGDILLTYLQHDSDYKVAYSNEKYILYELVD